MSAWLDTCLSFHANDYYDGDARIDTDRRLILESNRIQREAFDIYSRWQLDQYRVVNLLTHTNDFKKHHE